ncbi:hypothetical protein GQX73_g7677 [Xylaria multiplex]|uniref:Cytochrome P450 n=1 Tax=Xylaria multiplex TaxID=323545 RepID=A0A7C8IPQ0_9PEZI|nr:hypothetical protein GQX73_g7677 [Xylaria multiplex]
MGVLVDVLSWKGIFVVLITYLAGTIFYRLTLHPLAGFPGPKLAAITRWYEGYYDIVLNGQYTFKIKELHDKYGPVIRISPYELHVNDPAFLNTLYNHDIMKKYAWTYDAHTAKGSTAFTVDHDLHKARRQPLNGFFSKAKVASRQDMIQMYADKLCRRISQYVGTTFDLGAASLAFTQDVANDFIISKSYGSLDREDLDVSMLVFLQGAGREQYQDTKYLVDLATSNDKIKHRRTIIDEILESKLSPSDKTVERIYEDVSTISNAAFETTASVIRPVLFHVFSNPTILQRLRAELESVITTDLKTLEQLPYLTSVLKEGFRLGGGLSTRLQRVSEKDLFYGKWRIPAGHPVGMTPLLMHTDNEVHHNAKSFLPERWIDAETRKRSERGFAPFSKGSRICLGMHLAWAELYIVVATLVQRFDFSFPNATAEDFVEPTARDAGPKTQASGMAWRALIAGGERVTAAG